MPTARLVIENTQTVKHVGETGLTNRNKPITSWVKAIVVISTSSGELRAAFRDPLAFMDAGWTASSLPAVGRCLGTTLVTMASLHRRFFEALAA